MQRIKVVTEPEPNREHVIEGKWETKEIRIDGNLITVDMVIERIGDFFRLKEGAVQVFAWGPDALPQEVFALAYGCCEYTVPETWIHAFSSHKALEDFFLDCLRALPRADFTLRCSDVELRRGMRRVKRQWSQGVRVVRIPW